MTTKTPTEVSASMYLTELANCVLEMRNAVSALPPHKQAILGRRLDALVEQHHPIGMCTEAIAHTIAEVRDAP